MSSRLVVTFAIGGNDKVRGADRFGFAIPTCKRSSLGLRDNRNIDQTSSPRRRDLQRYLKSLLALENLLCGPSELEVNTPSAIDRARCGYSRPR